MKKFYLLGLTLGGLMIVTLSSFTAFETKVGRTNHYEEAYSAVQLNNGYLISGNYNTSGGSNNWKSYLVMVDNNGDTLWTKKNTSLNGFAKKTSDGNIIFFGGNTAGMTYDSIRVSKADINGNVIWSSQFQFSTCKNTITDIVEVSDGFVATGFYSTNSCSQPSFDAFIMKLDLQGNQEWVQSFTGNYDEQFHSVKQMPNGNYAAFGWSNSNTVNYFADYLLAIYSPQGDMLDWKQYGDEQRNYGYGLEVLNDGTFILNGYSNQMEVMHIGTDMKPKMTKKLHNSCGSSYFKVKKTQDNALALIGTENINGNCVTTFYKMKINGDVVWEKSFNGLVRDFIENSNGEFILTGFADYLPDMYITKFDSTKLQISNVVINGAHPRINQDIDIQKYLEEEGIVTGVNEQELEKKYGTIKAYPNPATDHITIEFSNQNKEAYQFIVYDFTGGVVMMQQNITDSRINIQKNWLAKGVYTYKLSGSGKTHCGKFIFQ